MSVLVKGMEMPKSCADCSFRVVSECFDDYCAAIKALRYIDTHNGSRQDWCPLVEVPTPHGELVDANDLLKDREGSQIFRGDYRIAFDQIIERVPTIIPADPDSAMEVTQNG